MLPPVFSDSRKNLSFSEFLASNLREGTRLRVYHVSTAPTSTNPIYASPPNQPDVVTTCESHFLGVSQELPGVCASSSLEDSNSNARRETADENSVLVLGIEVPIFTTPSLTTIFVSKADSSGFRSNSSTQARGSPSIIKVVTTAFLEWLVSRTLVSRTPEVNSVNTRDSAPLNAESEHSSPVNVGQEKQTCPKLVVSLFARSQNQYLFPGSIENSTKHVLDDRQLIRWWCHILDTLAKKKWHTHAAELHSPGAAGQMSADADAFPGLQHFTSPRLKVEAQGHIIVPGCDRAEIIKLFLPSSARYAQPGQRRWHTSYPVEFLTGHRAPVDGTTLPVRCMIPHFPDDPKARYCDDLDGSGIDDQGNWRSVKTLQQFWETMEYRQECASGRLVGFIWVTFNSLEDDADLAKDSPVPGVDRQVSDILHTDTTPNIQGTTVAPVASEIGNLASHASLLDTLVLSAEKYDILADCLINETDFGGLSAAKRSTKEWIKKAEQLSGTTDFGTLIEGRQAESENCSVAGGAKGASTGEKHSRDEAIAPQVNFLMGVRKKRKVDVKGEQDAITHATAIQPANEPIASPSGAIGTDQDRNGVTLLSAGLVRKKPKQ